MNAVLSEAKLWWCRFLRIIVLYVCDFDHNAYEYDDIQSDVVVEYFQNSKLLEKQSEEKRRKRRAEENSNAVTRKPEVDIVAKLKKKWKWILD